MTETAFEGLLQTMLIRAKNQRRAQIPFFLPLRSHSVIILVYLSRECNFFVREGRYVLEMSIMRSPKL
jgi:hypothetical protein